MKPGKHEARAIRRYACPLCQAPAGQWCVSRSDGATLLAHAHAERAALEAAARKGQDKEA